MSIGTNDILVTEVIYYFHFRIDNEMDYALFQAPTPTIWNSPLKSVKDGLKEDS